MHITVETGDRAAWVTVANVFGGPSHLFVEANSKARFPASSTVSVREVLTVEGVEAVPPPHQNLDGHTHAGVVTGQDGPNSQAQMPEQQWPNPHVN